MKAKLFHLFLILTGIFVFPGCEEDPLDLFYDDLRDGITGEWNVDEDSELFKKSSMNRFYTVTISKHPTDSSAVYVKGFYEFSDHDPVIMIMDGQNLSIPEQTIDGFTIQNGNGTISQDFEEILLYYYVSFTGDQDIVSARYTRPE